MKTHLTASWPVKYSSGQADLEGRSRSPPCGCGYLEPWAGRWAASPPCWQLPLRSSSVRGGACSPAVLLASHGCIILWMKRTQAMSWKVSGHHHQSWIFPVFLLFFLTAVWQLPLELRFVEVGYINLRFSCLSVYFFFSLSFFIVLRPSDFKGINFFLKPGEKEATVVGFFFVGLFFVFVFYHGALFHNLHLYITFTLASRLPGPLKIKINNCNLYQVSVPNRNSLQIRRLVLT